MQLLKLTKDIFLNFLFPQSNVYTACQSITESDLLEALAVSESQTPILTTSLFQYKDTKVQTLIKGLKYYGFRHAAELFGQYMGEFLLEELSGENVLGEFREPLLVPVPITQSKKIDRGYNQSDLLAKYTAKYLRVVLPIDIAYDAIRRIGIAPSQAHTENKEVRKNNVAYQFVVTNKAKIRGRNILLIDDVVATGATLKAVSDVLYKAGAKEVRALVVAH